MLCHQGRGKLMSVPEDNESVEKGSGRSVCFYAVCGHGKNEKKHSKNTIAKVKVKM